MSTAGLIEGSEIPDHFDLDEESDRDRITLVQIPRRKINPITIGLARL